MVVKLFVDLIEGNREDGLTLTNLASTTVVKTDADKKAFQEASERDTPGGKGFRVVTDEDGKPITDRKG